MGHKQYLALGQTARRLLGLPAGRGAVPLNMLISQQGKLNHGRLAVILFSICTVVLGIILSFVPWLDYIIFRELKLWNGSLSYSYWQKPGVVRLTKVYIFNVTNPSGFLEHGEKPKLVEVGPFVYREDMEKVNIKFHDNDTITYQHNKILRFVPELSVNKNQKLTVPNIPLLTVTSFSPNLAGLVVSGLASVLSVAYKKTAEPFVKVTAEQLVFGYDDPLVTLAHYFYPKGKRPNSQMGLLLARNGTLDEVSTIYTGQRSMSRFGYLDKINGLDHLPHWKESPCNDIRASEGSFFPPRAVTKSDLVHVYDKDICRILPLQYRRDVYKDGIQTGLYTPPASTFESADVNPDNKCYCQGEKCPPRGLQNISPCQYSAPVYLSYPHFYDAEPSLLDKFEGLKPVQKTHETYFMIQPKLGVPLEGFVRVQLNIKVSRAPNIYVNSINKFPDIIFPVMWIEEGIHEVTTPIWRWIYLATTVGPIAAPLLTYSMIVFGILTILFVFIKAYKSFVIGQNSIEIVEIGRETLRRGSMILHSTQKICLREPPYILLPQTSIDSGVREFSQSLGDVGKADLGLECETLIRSDNSFILSERRCSLGFRLPNF
ncbi:scavenger receptor class B member 1 isoform X1 [Leguminivora glycinivorella]|uniref:scavenger receptor class B member 1 isoform X1 n=1 Tax=Leguminivora glycinivorella TaxID=1035111 RepID=UPI00200FBE52|nr:scavenger receptor class B member 1 isoform X1 [Leguminivora glycinivorella]